jgi:aspartate/methionine/tyrosine aminotransferase
VKVWARRGCARRSSIAESIGCELRPWQLQFENGFRPDIEEAKRLISPRTAMVILNFPHNPTGASLTFEEQAELLDAVKRVGAYLVWDAAFADLTYDGEPLPDPSRRYDRCISLGTLSKAYGLPGLRVGWALASPDVLARSIELRDYITLHLSPLVEFIAQRAIEQLDHLLKPRLGQIRANLATLTQWCAEHQEFIDYARPQGGVSAFLRLPGVADVEGFCHRLAGEYKTLLVPGSCFKQPAFVRLGFGGAAAELEQGLGRFSSLLHQVRKETHAGQSSVIAESNAVVRR